MNYKKLFYIGLCVLLAGFTGCQDYLDQVPDDRQTIEEVFQKKQPSEEFLANVYNRVRDESNQWDNTPWSGNSDEIEVAWAKFPIYRINVGNWSPNSDPFGVWNFYYQGIRSASYFMNHIDGNDEILRLDGQQRIDQYKAEARFLRAWFYFMLMRQYGPVVLIGNDELPVDAPIADLQKPRSPFDECVGYVVGQLDSVAAVLPLVPAQNRDYGRATKGAALALKARLLLYAASPEYNGNPFFAGFKNQDGQNLISQTFDKEKWKQAADAAKAVIDLGVYQLYRDPSGDVVKSLRGVLLEPWNIESIFVRKSNALWDWDYNCSPRRGGGWNGIGATQEMVDAYFMNDGLPIDQSPLYTEQGFTDGIYNMYKNREPRFYASVLYNGRKYKGGSVMQDSITLDFTYSGADGKQNGGEDYSHTGYLVYKSVSPETNRLTGQRYDRPFVFFRLGEMYLNYAEALAEYGGAANEEEASKYLNLIRQRAGLPQYGEGTNPLPAVAGLQLIEKIRMERRVELAFESHRWFDVRRWKIVEAIMGDLHGMNIDKNGNEFYQRVVAAHHKWDDAYYWWPIPQYEMDRGTLIVQNPGW